MTPDASDVFVIIFSSISNFFDSTFFFWVKMVIGVYTVVLFIDVILLLVLGSFGESVAVTRYGANYPAVYQKSNRKKWKKIQDRMKSGQEDQMKLAVLEADRLADFVFSLIQKGGSNIRERLEMIRPGHVENPEKLLQAHEVRNRIVREDNFALDIATAQEALEAYYTFLQDWEAI